MQTKPENLPQSTETVTNGNTLMPSQQPQSEYPSSMWYQHIADLPLRKYIDCTVDNNLYALVISGKPTDEQLQEAWLTINEEYADAIGDSERSLIIKLHKEIAEISITLSQCALIIEILSIVVSKQDPRILKYQKDLNNMLNQRFTYEVENRAKEMQTATRLLKGFKLKLALKEEQLRGFTSKDTGDKKAITREYFQSALISLSDFAKYQIPDTITTYEFCERIKRIHVYLQEQKLKGHGK